ncbi:MAG: hypothetical protein WCI03_06955 [bacterium]|jgi:hypothetical protein
MKKNSWSEIEEGLRSQKAPPPQNDAESFQLDFKARASLMRQDSASPAAAFAWFPVLSWRIGIATAAAVLIAGLVLWPASSTLVTQVKSLQVLAPHSGVIIMTDEDNPGTVVWVTDLESDDGSKG